MITNRQKIVGGGTRLSVLVLTLLLVLNLSANVTFAAYESGDTIRYTGEKEGDDAGGVLDGGSVLFRVGDKYIGTCCEANLPWSASGTATVQTLSNSHDLRKAAYYFGVVKGWQDGLGMDRKLYPEGSEEYKLATNARRLEVFFQYLNGTIPSTWEAGLNVARSIEENYPEWRNVTVPRGFEAYIGKTPSSTQSFLFFWDAPYGKMSLKKASANTGITG